MHGLNGCFYLMKGYRAKSKVPQKLNKSAINDSRL